MIVIVASGQDEPARLLAARWGAALLTPLDLSAPGWRYEALSRESGTAVAAGRRIRTNQISGVLTRLPCVADRELDHVETEDRAYVASEMQAFLLAWLSGLSCPVLNRPTPECLCGPAWHVERWLLLAASLGIPCEPVRRRSDRTREPRCADPGTGVTVIGERCFGAANSNLAEHASRLACAAGVGLLEVRFTEPALRPRFAGVNLCPDLTDPEIADQVLNHFREATVC